MCSLKMIALLGKKLGMTQIFSEDGKLVGITAIEAGPCPILAIRGKNIQIGFDAARAKSLKKPKQEFFKKLSIAPLKLIREVLKEPNREYKVGEELKVDLFKAGDFVGCWNNICAVLGIRISCCWCIRRDYKPRSTFRTI